MIDVSEVYIPEIDEQKTILNGKKLCMKYQSYYATVSTSSCSIL